MLICNSTVVVANGYAQCFAQDASIFGKCVGRVWSIGFQCCSGCGDALADEVFVLGDCAVGQAIEKGEHVFVFFDFKGRFAKVVAIGQVEPAGEPAVHGFAHFEVVAVGRVNLDLRDVVVGVVEVVYAFDGGVFDVGGVLCPVL